jgi:hypothetical protein
MEFVEKRDGERSQAFGKEKAEQAYGSPFDRYTSGKLIGCLLPLTGLCPMPAKQGAEF